MRRYGRAVLGGTFDHLHLGHEILLEAAFRVGRTVSVGLTSERYLAAHPKPGRAHFQSYSVRRRHLVAWLRRHHAGASWAVVPIHDSYGGSVAPGVGVLVVSADTVEGGRRVNAERVRRGLRPVPLTVVPLALADDLKPVASRRIRAGTIDARGRRIAPIRVALRAPDPRDAATARRVVSAIFPRATFVPLGTSSPSRGPGPRSISGRKDSPAELTLGVVRAPEGGWTIREESPQVRLRPVHRPGSRPSDLARGLRRVLRPGRRPVPTESF